MMPGTPPAPSFSLVSIATRPVRQPPLWGARADDWAAIQEWMLRPAYDAILDELAPWPDATLLDLGCGSGGFAGLAAARGARVAGVDAAPELVDIAERRLNTGAFRVGDMARLPYADGSFAVVSGLNSFQYAAVPAAALAEAARVVRPGGVLVGAVWAAPDECDGAACVAALGGPPADPFALSGPGVLENLFKSVGLRIGQSTVVACPWHYRDEETALRGLLSAGPAVWAIGRSGENAVVAAMRETIAPYRRHDGSYLLRNTVRYVVARVG
jgi:SAM-dependent methyltransferase